MSDNEEMTLQDKIQSVGIAAGLVGAGIIFSHIGIGVGNYIVPKPTDTHDIADGRVVRKLKDAAPTIIQEFRKADETQQKAQAAASPLQSLIKVCQQNPEAAKQAGANCQDVLSKRPSTYVPYVAPSIPPPSYFR